MIFNVIAQKYIKQTNGWWHSFS